MGTGKLLRKPNKLLGSDLCDGLASRPGGVEVLLAASCYRIRDKLRQLWASLGSKASNSQYIYLKKIADDFNFGQKIVQI